MGCWSSLVGPQGEFSHLVLLAMFDCVDDTKLVKQAVLSVSIVSLMSSAVKFTWTGLHEWTWSSDHEPDSTTSSLLTIITNYYQLWSRNCSVLVLLFNPVFCSTGLTWSWFLCRRFCRLWTRSSITNMERRFCCICSVPEIQLICCQRSSKFWRKETEMYTGKWQQKVTMATGAAASS